MTDSPTVFIVDDDPSVLRALRRLFESAGFKVETFAGARAFLARFQPRRNTCLLVDLRMPGMSGLELQEELAQRRAGIPIVMMSGYATQQMTAAAKRAGVFGFLQKPFEDEQLLDCIQRALARNAEGGDGGLTGGARQSGM